MRVSKPRVVEKGDEVRVSVTVEVETPCSCEFPPDLWFSFPSACREYVTDRADGFAVALLPLAMTLGERIEIEGDLSPRLVRGMEEYQRIQALWQPERFERVEILARSLKEPDPEPGRVGVGCGFSGGVDSFHTLQRHLAENESDPSQRISHCLMISGFGADADLDEGRTVRAIAEAYRPMMDRLGIEILVARTNLMDLYEPRLLMAAFGAAITATALVLGRLFSRFFIASSYRFDYFVREGASALFDHLLGTEVFEVGHDAIDSTRVEKIAALVDWSETWSSLRVCWLSTQLTREGVPVENCCRCEKCLRTMATLKMAGALERITVFPKPFRHRDLWTVRRVGRNVGLFWSEIAREARRTRSYRITFDLGVSWIFSVLAIAITGPPRALHLFIERRSESYARLVERYHPRYRSGWRWIRKLN